MPIPRALLRLTPEELDDLIPLALANLVAAGPGRVAARLRPAAVLRTE